MCLDTVDKEPLVIREAFKCFSVNDKGKLSSIYMHYKFKKRRWMKTESELITYYDSIKYNSGFHSFVKLKDAIDYLNLRRGDNNTKVIHRILIKDITASGKQYTERNYGAAIVSKQIYIMEEVYMEE